MVFRAERAIWSNIVKTHAYIREMHKFEKHNPSLPGAVYKSGTGTGDMGTGTSGHRDACVGTGTWERETRDLRTIKYGTRGRVGRGRGDVKNRDAGDAGCE